MSAELYGARAARILRLEGEQVPLDAVHVPRAGRMDGDDPSPAAHQVDPRSGALWRRGRNNGFGLEPGPALRLGLAPLPPRGAVGLRRRGIPQEHDVGAAAERVETPRVSPEVDDVEIEGPRSFLQHQWIVSLRNFTLLSSRSRWNRMQASKIWR